MGGLVLGIRLTGCANEDGAPPGAAPPFAPNLLLRVHPDGSVVLVAPRPELGQGVHTSLPMLVAEELAVPWNRVRVEQADFDPRFADLGGQGVGGSYSVRGSWEPLRQAGAAAREMLVTAAAGRWSVAVGECRAEEGRVIHGPSGRSVGYGEVAGDAAELPLPSDPSLLDRARLVGSDVPSVDHPGLVRGAAPFGLDVELPGMLRGVILHSRIYGGRVGQVDDAAARAVTGVVDVVTVDPERWPDFPPNSPKPPASVVVLADRTWAALRGREALDVTWEADPGPRESTEAFWSRCRARAATPPERVLRRDGDVEAAMETAAGRLVARYRVPFLAHVPMEPMNATARVGPDSCEVWVPTQNPEAAAETAALVSGLPLDAVTVHPLRMGGALGRRYYSDFVAEAVDVAGAVGRPVQLTWPREEDVRHSFYRPAGLHVMEGAVAADGRMTAWSHHLINASRYTALGRTDGPPGAGELYEFDFPAGFVSNFQMAYSSVESPIPRGQWRSIAHSANVFVVESFVDELAHAAGADPLEFRLRLIGAPREVPFFSTTYDSGRLRDVLSLAAERAGWGDPLPAGRARGVAASFANSAFVAHVVEASVDDEGGIRVHRVVSAVDIGTVVHPPGARAQVEGSVVQALSAALGEEIRVEEGAVVQGNFHDYPILRMEAAPDIEVHFVDRGGPPRGMGEGALPPLAPAVMNAVFAASGVRVRELPTDSIRREEGGA